MKEQPLLMSRWGVRAILDGHKTQTRRPLKPQPVQSGLRWKWRPKAGILLSWQDGVQHPEMRSLCPQGIVGVKLWLREKFAIECPYGPASECDHQHHVVYWATENPAVRESVTARWRPSIHMPRWACRVVLEITDVRVERVQDISDADAMSEGVLQWYHATQFDPLFDWSYWAPQSGSGAAAKFSELWDDIYAKKGLEWKQAPWVWVLKFKRMEA